MGWIRELSKDRKVVIVIDPTFSGSIIELARAHVTWVIAFPALERLFGEAVAASKTEDLYEVDRGFYDTDLTLDQLLLDTLGMLDDQMQGYESVEVIGIKFDNSLEARLGHEGLYNFQSTDHGFTAAMNQKLRNVVIGRTN